MRTLYTDVRGMSDFTKVFLLYLINGTIFEKYVTDNK